MATRDNNTGRFVKGQSGNMKECTKCCVYHPIENYYKGNGKDGKDSRCKGCEKLRRYIQYTTQPEKEVLSRVRSRARNKGLKFNLTLSDVPEIPKTCLILDIPLIFNMGGRRQSDSSPTLDRKDNSKGYIKGNVAWISSRANMLKLDSTVEELEKILKYMRS